MSLEKAQHTPNAHTTAGQSPDSTMVKQIILTRRSPAYWRVTFDHPPLNIFGPETIPQLNEIITALEIDEQVKVVVFDSAVDGFFLTHYNFLAKLEDSTRLPAGRTGLQPLPDMLVRLSRCPVVSIVSIRGRATGVGSELALASDMRFASREKAILSQWEVGARLVPGGGPMARLPRLIGRGRALEVLLGADDFLVKPFTEYTADDFRALVSTNLAGFIYITQLAVKQMQAQKSGGSIVSITAALVDNPIAGVPASVPMITKGRLEAGLRSLASEYAKEHIRFNAVAPGVVETPLHADDPKELLKTLSPMGSISTIEDIASAVVYLTEARQITGEVLHVDGGAHNGKW